MSSLKTRKGMGTLVSTLAIMMVSIVLAVGAGYAVTNLIGISLSPTLTCAPLQIAPPITIEQVLHNTETGTIDLTLKRAFDATTLTDFSLRVKDPEGMQQGWTCTESCGGCSLMGAGESKTYVLHEEYASGSVITLETQGCVIASTMIEE